ncbi:MAG: cupredoxin domain-containing protein [Bacillota bacterium]
MTTSVLLAVVLLIAWTALLGWFFFGPRKGALAQTSAGGVQELSIAVQGGYSPAQIVVKRGMPVRLTFRRTETSSCSERVVFPDFNLSKKLPENENVTLEFTPDKDGAYTFTCGMGMYKGTLIVQGGEA